MNIPLFLFETFTDPLTILLVIVGSLIGIIFGAIPGLSGAFAVIIFMPLTYTMDVGPAIVFLICLWVGGCSGGFIGSVLLGIPGSPASVATCWDGYPMAMKGLAGKALSIGMIASFIGTVTSAGLGAFLSQQVARVAFLMGPWEYCGLCVCAITLVLAISRGNMFKGLAAASLGLLVASVGASPIDAEARFTFGNVFLYGGLDMTAVLMGVFAVSKILHDFGRGSNPIPEIDKTNLRGLGLKIKDITSQATNIVRSWGVGFVIGFLPGMGAGLSNIVAYSVAKNASKTPEKFGTGIEDGVWASEVSNNASMGGDLVPMTALGIPGDTTTGLLIGALTVHGLEMGPMVFRNSGHIVYTMYLAVAVSAVAVLIMQFFGKRFFPYILKVPDYIMHPSLLVISLISAYIASSNMFNIYMMLFFTAVGIVMLIGKMPTAPFLLAFILGPTIEINMLKGFQYSKTFTTFFTRPLSGVLMGIAILSILSPVLRYFIDKKRGVKSRAVVVEDDD